jgi:alpha-aminoadipic semialdehyde synthase
VVFGWIDERIFMKGIVGIRRENIDITERRAPLTPNQVQQLTQAKNIEVIVEPSKSRIFSDDAYRQAGAKLSDDLSRCNIIFGVKEVPNPDLIPGAVYCYFSHTIKGQPHNMPMLKRVLDIRNTLIDYECVQDGEGRRLIFFGKFAGFAGMINSLWTLGLRLASHGLVNPFSTIKQAMDYDTLDEVRDKLARVGDKIRENGLPEALAPFICGFTGYGHVSQGAQEIFDILPNEEIKAAELSNFTKKNQFSNKKLYKVVFSEQDMFRPIESGNPFNLQEYYNFPEKYHSIFEQYIPYLGMVINGIFWAPQYPRLITKDFLRNYFQQKKEMPLMVIGDITCDIEGSIECTVKATNSENPVYVYHPTTESVQDGYEGEGIVILAVDKLPSELPKEATQFFGSALLPHIPELARTDFSQKFGDLNLSASFKQAIIAHQGSLTSAYEYLSDYIKPKSKG